jgi:hypothetical protein
MSASSSKLTTGTDRYRHIRVVDWGLELDMALGKPLDRWLANLFAQCSVLILILVNGLIKGCLPRSDFMIVSANK